jgi:glycosyltransferase involved in cell wall biosynthesis
MPTISVVVPAMNEAENLAHVLPRIPREVHEVILVDGNSHDDTIAVAQQLLPDIRVVQQQGRGKGAALRSGFAAATGDIIVMIDADGSTAPEEIPAFVRALTDGADYAKGSRFVAGGGTSDMPLHRKLGNMGFVYLVRLFFGGHYTDLCYGYNAFWARIVPMLELERDGFEIETEMNIRVLRRGLVVAEVPSFESERVYGVGRLRTLPDGWRVLKTIFRERFRSPLGPVTRPAPTALATVGTPVMAERPSRFPMAFEILRGEVAPEVQALAEEHEHRTVGAGSTGE